MEQSQACSGMEWDVDVRRGKGREVSRLFMESLFDETSRTLGRWLEKCADQHPCIFSPV